MSVALSRMRGPAGSTWTPATAGRLRVTVAATVVVVYVVAVLAETVLRRAEACLSAALVGLTGLQAACVGDSTIYRIDDRLTGHSITVGCTAILLLFPFVILATVLTLVRRVPVANTLAALAVASVVVVATNQLRMIVICTGMRVWGIERGYAITHIVLGTIVSAIGMLVAAHLFLRVVLTAEHPVQGH